MKAPSASDSSEKPSDPDPEQEEKDSLLTADREERDKFIRELYKKLQAQFPGIDPRREPAYPMPNPGQQQLHNGQRPGGPNGGPNGNPSSTQGSPGATPQAQRSGQTPNQAPQGGL